MLRALLIVALAAVPLAAAAPQDGTLVAFVSAEAEDRLASFSPSRLVLARVTRIGRGLHGVALVFNPSALPALGRSRWRTSPDGAPS